MPDPTDPLGYAVPVYKERTIQTPPPPTAGRFRGKRYPTSKPYANELPAPPVMLPRPKHEGQENLRRTKVIVTYLESPGEFYVRVDREQEMFQRMSKQLAQQLESPEQVPSSELAPGLICAVQMEEKWNRYRIVRLDQQEANILLLDVGKSLSVPLDTIYRLKKLRGQIPTPPWHCRLWGVRPAGHLTNWSRSSADLMADSVKKAGSVYIQEYLNVPEEEENGLFREVRYVRFYHEFVLPGGPLECNQIVTGCVNDELLDKGLALKKPMEVNVQPIVKRWPPSLILPPQLDAIPRWMDSDGFLYIQHLKSSPFCHVDVISKLLNFHYSTATTTTPPPTEWETFEPCVAR